jgi:transcriptional regulator with XRE-family HTH domain
LAHLDIASRRPRPHSAEVAALIRKATGNPVTGTTIRKLRHGQAANPQKRLIEAMARFFAVPPDFFFDDYDDGVSSLQEQVEVLAGYQSLEA